MGGGKCIKRCKGKICGNGHKGIGFPGERQVNDPRQDAVAPDHHITQSETTLAAYGSYILFGFNDSNRTTSGGGDIETINYKDKNGAASLSAAGRAFYNISKTSNHAEESNFSGYAFSSDGGVTWCDCGSVPLNPGWEGGGDPVVAVDSNGVFYYAQIGTTDTGESVIIISSGYANPKTRKLKIKQPIVAGKGRFPNGIQDKEWIAVGPDKAGPKGAESIFLSWSEFKTETSGANLRFAKLSTGLNPRIIISGKTIVPGPIQGSFPVLDSEGNLYIFYEDFKSGRSIRVIKSTDGGKTFGEPIMVSSVTQAVRRDPICNDEVIKTSRHKAIRVTEFPHAAAGPDDTLYVVWDDGRNRLKTGIDIYLAYSTDKALSWKVVRITRSKTHEFMPSVIANCSGAHIQYTKFNDPNNKGGIGNGTFALFQRSFSISKGLGKETMVSTVFSPVPDTCPNNFDTAVVRAYMGDYNQIITGRGENLLHAWSDNRNGPNGSGNNPDVFFIQTNPK